MMTIGNVLDHKNQPRPLCQIAREISKNWERVNYAAEPYLAAMFSLDSINENFYADSGRSIVAYFLANAQGWRGETAKRIKAELKSMLNGKGQS